MDANLGGKAQATLAGTEPDIAIEVTSGAKERAWMLDKCTNCGATIIGGRRDEYGVFCSRECQSFYRYPGFCPACAAESTDETARPSVTVNGIGFHMYGSRDRCPTCNSVIRTQALCVLYVPVWFFGKYRVRYTGTHSYLSRKLRKV